MHVVLESQLDDLENEALQEARDHERILFTSFRRPAHAIEKEYEAEKQKHPVFDVSHWVGKGGRKRQLLLQSHSENAWTKLYNKRKKTDDVHLRLFLHPLRLLQPQWCQPQIFNPNLLQTSQSRNVLPFSLFFSTEIRR
ncbi:hypothetical protein BLNAU_8630 [Blattamonas nauphoetae]|uniref:Uncharacterized protein n=1 Tax=Blattamonas nauphoetae TaxID=2049346 RepID=A0ABQ9XY60_9EUKA|nr:hypothetical protein BLNAU_8630 [Blattamonas nauphoetae]